MSFKEEWAITLDWAICIDMSALTRGSGFNVLTHVGGNILTIYS